VTIDPATGAATELSTMNAALPVAGMPVIAGTLMSIKRGKSGSMSCAETAAFQALSARRTFIRYDERGNVLSDWDAAEISFAAFVRDLETVVEALGLDRFPLLDMSQGCAVSIDYAVRHPDRVSALILIGGYAAGWRIGASPEERERREGRSSR